MKFLYQPGSTEVPQIIGMGTRDLQLIGDFIDGKALAAFLNDLSCLWVYFGELLDFFLENKQLDMLGIDACLIVEQFLFLEVPALPLRVSPPGTIDEDVLHHQIGGGEEMILVVEMDIAMRLEHLTDHFINQRGGLHAVARVLFGHLGGSDAIEFVVMLNKKAFDVGKTLGRMVSRKSFHEWHQQEK